MLEIIKILNIVVSVLLMVIILMQQKKSSLNLTTFSSEAVKIERRGPEKTIHTLTILLGGSFIVLSLMYYFMA